MLTRNLKVATTSAALTCHQQVRGMSDSISAG